MINYHEIRTTRKRLESLKKQSDQFFFITVFAVLLGTGFLAIAVRLTCIGLLNLSTLVK